MPRRLKSSDSIPFCLRLAAFLWLLAAFAVAGCASRETTKRRFLQSGDTYVAQGRYEAAIIQYRNAVQTDGRFAEARLKLARAYEHTGNRPGAFREYVRAADLLPGDDDAQINAARQLLLAHRSEDAQARAARVVARSPHNVAASVLLGNTLAGLKDLDTVVGEMETAFMEGFPLALTDPAADGVRRANAKSAAAEQVFTQAVTLNPESAPARLGLANFYLAVTQPDDAERTLKEALAIDPHNTLANRALAVFYIASRRPLEAEASMKAAAEAAPDRRPTLLLADYYTRARRDEDARRVLTPLTRTDDAFAEASTRLAEMDARDGNDVRAYSRVAEVLKRDARNVRALTLRGQLRLTDGRPAAAIVDLQSAVAAAPASLASHALLASAYERAGALEAALKQYESILKIAPASTVAHRELAKLHLIAGHAGPAVDHAERALAASPSDPAARLLFARALVANGDVDRALPELKALVREDPGNADVRATLGTLMLGRREWDEARRWFAAALEADPANAEASMGLVNVAIETRRFADARARLDAWLTTPRSERALDIVAATAYARMGANRQAEELLLKTIQAEPSRLSTYVLLGRLYMSQKRLDEAKRQFEIVLAKEPASVGAATMLGLILEAQHKPDQAQAMYERALDIDAAAPVAANNLAWLHANTDGNLDVALQLAQTATRKLPDSAEVSDTLGWIYYQKNMTDQAIPAFEQSASLVPGNAEFQFHLGLAYLKAGRQQPAKQALARALHLDPNFAGADEARRLVGR